MQTKQLVDGINDIIKNKKMQVSEVVDLLNSALGLQNSKFMIDYDYDDIYSYRLQLDSCNYGTLFSFYCDKGDSEDTSDYFVTNLYTGLLPNEETEDIFSVISYYQQKKERSSKKEVEDFLIFLRLKGLDKETFDEIQRKYQYLSPLAKEKYRRW